VLIFYATSQTFDENFWKTFKSGALSRSGNILLQNTKESGQASPLSLLRSAPQVNHQPPKIPAPRTSGLARSFYRLPHNPRFVVFFVTLFAKGKKDVCTPTATTVLHLCQKKNNSKLLYITCSYIRALA
jgi:hypothetical protein